MELFYFLKSLDIKDRHILCLQCGYSLSYFNKLANNCTGLPLNDLPLAILNSKFNRELPESVQFTKDDYRSYRAYRMKAKIEKLKATEKE